MEKSGINNQFYEELGAGWHERDDHPIALLRAENRVRNPWIAGKLQPNSCVLDIGCGAGLLTNDLAKRGHRVSGIDLSEGSLLVARANDPTGSVDYRTANAYCLPYQRGQFDAVFAMDLLEHVEEPHLVIAEASRVLRPGGLFFYHTFNRNWLSYLLVIKGVDWFVPNAPKNMHVYPLFIKPEEMDRICHHYGLKTLEQKGLVPSLSIKSLHPILMKRRITADFTFKFCRSLKTGYVGIASSRNFS